MTKLKDNINKSALGYHYEQVALNYLQEHEIQLLSKNFSSKLGEIDIIFLQNIYVCFG